MSNDIKVFSQTVPLPDLAATEALGARIAAGIRPADTIALEGDLGAGKTTLARAILRALGVRGTVPSPAFTQVQHYETQRMPVSHYDLYRIEQAEELDELGLEEALANGAVLIEWAERAGDRLPADALHVCLAQDREQQRAATLSGPAHWARRFSESAIHAG